MHRECLARASLPVREDRDGARVEHVVKDRLQTVSVKVFIGLVAAESVVKHELLVLYVLGDAINFEFAFVHRQIRVANRYSVNLSIF